MDLRDLANVGEQVPAIVEEYGKGVVYSVHDNSFYCLMGNREIILIHDSMVGSIPFGISVKNLGCVLSKFNLLSGMLVKYSEGTLAIPKIKFKLTLGEAPSKRKPPTKLISQDLILSAILRLQQILKENSNNESIACFMHLNGDLTETRLPKECKGLNPFCKEVCRRLDLLVKAIEEKNNVLIKSVIGSLIGLGVGLTPSADDVLVGLISTLHYGQRVFGYKNRALCFLYKSVLECKGRTNPISWAYLNSAVLGGRFSLIEKVIEALLFQPEKAIEEPTNKLLSVGSNSGSEMLMGISLGLNLLLNDNVAGVDAHV